MIPRDQRRRSPERERRRRADRRQSREQLAAAALAAAAVGQTAAKTAGPSSTHRSRANSSTSSSAVTSSDEDSAPKNTGWGFRSFFSLASSKKVRKRRSFRKKNYSSSSIDSNLAYGGYQSRSSLESQRGARRRSGPQRKISQTYSQHSHHDKEYQQHNQDQYRDHPQYEQPQHEYQRPEYVPQDQYAHSDQTTPRPGQPTQHPHAQPEPYYQHQHQQYHQQQPHAYQHPAQHYHGQPEYDPELFTPDGRPNLARTTTDEEIIELGRKISDLARASNLRDLERAGKQRPSQLVGAATAISNFRRQNPRRNGRRGLAPSKSSKRDEQSDDDQGWDTASDSDSDSGDNAEEASASDSDLAYGSSPQYSDEKLSSSPAPAPAPPPPTISPQKPYIRNKAIDPSKFGPVNSLHGLVTPLNGFRPTEDSLPPRQSKPWLSRFQNDPLPDYPTPADELDTPTQMHYPIATPDPRRFDAVTSPTLVSGSPLIISRPVTVAIQAPKPRVPVSTRALEEHPMPRQRSADGRLMTADSALAKSIGNAAGKHEVIRDDTPPSNYRQHRSRAQSNGSAHPSHTSHHSHAQSHTSRTSHTSHVPVHVQVPLPTTHDLEFDDWHDFEDRNTHLASDVPQFTDPAAAGVAATLIGTALFQDRYRRDDEEDRNLDPNHVLAEYKQRVQQEEEQRRKAEEAEKERLEKERQEREARAAAAIKREREAREAQEAAEREAREKKEAEERVAAVALELAAQRQREEREAREALEKMEREAEERAAAAAAAQRELEALEKARREAHEREVQEAIEKARREAQEREVQEAIDKARREALERDAAAAERERQEREHLEKVRREAEDLAIAARRELETRETALEAVAKEARRLRDEADYREQYERRVREAREMQYKEERRMYDARYRADRENMIIDVEPRRRSTSRQTRDESPEEKRSNTGKETEREEHHRPKREPVTIINESDVPKDEPKPKVEEPTRSVSEKKRESMGDTLDPKPKKPSKEERRAKRAETLRLLAEMQKELELEKERARKLAELEAAEQQQVKPKDEEPRKSSQPVVPELSKSPKDQVSHDFKAAPAPGPSPSKSPKGLIDPFQFQVPDDAFATPVHATPARPLTPQVYTVPEPDFSPPKRRQLTRALTDAELEIRERVTRRDSFEIQQRQEEIRRSRNASEQPTTKDADKVTVPETDKETLMAEEPERERSRSHNRAGSRVRESEPLRDANEEPERARSWSRQSSHVREAEPTPDPQTEANKWYRDYVSSRREERLRSTSPSRSVVDKYDDSVFGPPTPVIVTAEPTIITAEPSWATAEPTDDGKPKKGKYAEPDADVRIDHVILPRDLHRFLKPAEDHSSLHAPTGQPMFSSRDPSCERERPLLNLVLPTPAPTPTPERERRERARQAARESEVEPEESRLAPVAAEESKKPNYILNARGEIEIIAPTPKDEDTESVKSDGWVEPVADTGLTHVVVDRSRQAAVEAIKRALQPKRERKASIAWGTLAGAVMQKVAEDRKAAAEQKAEVPAAEEKSLAPEVEEKVEVLPAPVVEVPIVEEKQSEEQKLREIEPETKPADVAAPTKTEVQPDVELPRQSPYPDPEPHLEPHHEATPVPAIAIHGPESPKATEEPKDEEAKEELKEEEEQSALPEGESHEEKEDEATRQVRIDHDHSGGLRRLTQLQVVDEATSSPIKPKRTLPKSLAEPSIFSPYRPTFSDNFADVVCGEHPNPEPHADTYTWRREAMATQSSIGDEWESILRKAQIGEDGTTTNPTEAFNPDNREPPERLGKEFSFEVVEHENSQTFLSDESARESEKASTEQNGVSDRRPSNEFIEFLKNQTNNSALDRKHEHIIATTEMKGNSEDEYFLGNAGTHGAGAGSAEDSEAATASDSKDAEAQNLPRPNATQASMDSTPIAESKEEDEEEEKSHGSNAGSDSAPEPTQLRHTDSRFIDPEVLVHRPFTPAIDPQYGDLLPLPPYPTLTGPGYRYLADLPSPLDFDLEQLPALPESRPSTPPPTSGSPGNAFKAAVAAMMGTQSLIRRQRGHTRSRSALDGTAPVRVPSQTAVPIQFRLKGKKRAGSVHSLPPSEAWGQSSASRPSSAHGDAAAASDGKFPARSRPRPTSWEGSMREFKPLYLVERNAATAAAAAAVLAPAVDTEEALPPPESFELPEDDDLDLLPALPESAPESDAGSPVVAPQIVRFERDVPTEGEDEVLKPVDLSTSKPETVEAVLPALEAALTPETVRLPVDEDLDLLPALPESDAGSPIVTPVNLSTDLPVDEDLKQVEVPSLASAERALPAPETVELPVDEDLDLLPALPESPTTESAVPVSLPAVAPEVVEEVPAAEIPQVVEAPKEFEIPAPETVKLPADEDLDLLPALPASGLSSPTLPEPALPVSVGEDEAFSTPSDVLPVPRSVNLPEDIELPAEEDLDLLPALPDGVASSPTTETVPVAVPISAPEVAQDTEEMPEAVIEVPTIVAREILAPEAVRLPVDEDLDLLPALPDSLATSPTTETMPSQAFVEEVVEETSKVIEHEVPVPENIKLPVDDDLDLLPALPDSIATSPTTETTPSLPILAPEITDAPKEIEIAPETVTLPADEDLDLLPALPASGNSSPERSTSPVLEKATSPVIIPEPETVALPVDEDLDLLPALPESGPASPTKEHASLAASPVVAPATEKEIDNEVEPVSEVSRGLEVLEPETISLPVDEDLDLLPALPESGPASPALERSASPAVPVLEKEEAVPEAISEVVREVVPEPENVALPVDQDLDLLPALPENGLASPIKEHASLATPPVIEAVVEKEPVVEEVPEVIPELLPLPEDQDLDLLPALPESAPVSPTKEHASLATSPITEAVIEKGPSVEVITELLPLPDDEDLDLLPALPESGPVSPTKEFAFPVSSPTEISQAVPDVVPEDISKTVPEVVPELLPLPTDQDLDLLPALPESGSSSPVQEEFAAPVAQPADISVDTEVEQPSKDTEDVLSITIPEPESVPLPAESDDGLWALPSLPQSRAGSGYASPVAANSPTEVVPSPVKAIEETSELPVSINPETVRLPSDDGLWALPSLPVSHEGSGYASPGAAMPTFGVEPPMEDLEEYFPDHYDQGVVEEVSSKEPLEVEMELPLNSLPQLPADEDLDLLPALPDSRGSSPDLAVTLPVEEHQEMPQAEESEKQLDLSELPALPVDEDLELLPGLPESRNESPEPQAETVPAVIPEQAEEEKEQEQEQDFSKLPPLPIDEDLDVLPALPESRNESPEPEVSLPVNTPEPADLSKLPALPADEDLDILPALPESRNDSPEPQPSFPKAISPEVLPLPADEDLDLLPELPESRGSSPDQEASLPVAVPQSPIAEEAVKDVTKVPVAEEDLSYLPALPVDEDLELLPALPDSPAADNFPEEEETQTTWQLEEFTQPAWDETQPTQMSEISEEDFAVPAVKVDEVSRDLADLPALPESRSGTPLSDLPALPESRSSSRSEDIETAPSLEDPSELPPLPESREDSPEPRSPLPDLGAQPATESHAKQIAPSQTWTESETQGTENPFDDRLPKANIDFTDEPLPASNELIVGHVRRDSFEAAHPSDIYEKPSSHNQAKSPMLIGNNDPNEIDYKLAETIYEDMCDEDDASTVAASDAPSFLSGANAEQKEQIAKALAGDSEATSSLSPESSFRVLQYLKKRDAAMKQGQTYEEPEAVVPGPSSQYEDEEEQVPQEIEDALESIEEVLSIMSTSRVLQITNELPQQSKKAKGVSFEPSDTPTDKPDVPEDVPADHTTSDQSTPRQELRIGIPGPSSRVANLEAVNDEVENIPDAEAQKDELPKTSTDKDKHTESPSNQEESSGEPQPANTTQEDSILGGGLVAEPERQRPMRVASPENQWGTLGDLDDLDDEDDDDVSEYSPGGTNLKRHSLTRLPTFPGVTAFLGGNLRSNSAPSPSDVPVQDERDYYSGNEREMLGEEQQQQELTGDELEERLERVKMEEEEEVEKVEGADESQTGPEKLAETEPEPAQEHIEGEPSTTEKKGKKKKQKKKNKGKGKADVDPEAPLPTTQADLETTLAPEAEEPKEPKPDAEPASKLKKSKKKKNKKNKSAAASTLEEPTNSNTAKPTDGPGVDRHSTWPMVKSDAASSEQKTAPESEPSTQNMTLPKGEE